MESLLIVEEVSKNFAGIQAVNGLSVTLEKGRIAGLIGPNGAGKTTLFNLITGFHGVSSGRIYYQGTDITGLPPYRIARLGIARSFQDVRLYTKMTVLENAVLAQPKQAGEKLRNVYFRPGRVRRRDREFTVTVTPRLDETRGVGRIGFQPLPVLTRVNPLQALGLGVRRTGEFIVLLFGAVRTLARDGKFFESLGGPVAAGNMLAQTASTGVQAFLNVAAFLSVMIGIFNLLPIPALDGGRLAFLLGEAVRRRPLLDARKEGLVHTVGFALLLLLLFGVTLRDFRRLFP